MWGRSARQMLGTVLTVSFALSPFARADLKPAVQGPRGIAGYRSGHALFYVVPVDGGVVLIDCGFEVDAGTVRAALANRPVVAVLLTHGHVDHIAGARALGQVPVYGHPRALSKAMRLKKSKGLIPGLGERLLPQPPAPLDPRPVRDHQCLVLGLRRFCALRLRGHTAGSLAWIEGNVLFSGDAIMGGDKGLGLAPAIFSDDPSQARRSVRRLVGLPVDIMLDGHAGRTDQAAVAIRRYVEGEAVR